MSAATPKVNVPLVQGSAATLRRQTIGAKVVWLAAFLTLVACTDAPCVVVHSAAGKEVNVRVEIANTNEMRQRGLMYRKQLADDAGMLFVFPSAQPQQFWMKNTPLPLDMIFIGADRRIVGIVENTKPFSTEGRGVGKPSKYVLEVNGGFSAKHGLRAGDRVDFHGIADSKN